MVTVNHDDIEGGKCRDPHLCMERIAILRVLTEEFGERSTPREKDNPYVFIGPRAGGLSNMAMAAVLRRMDRAEITVHGFRSTFRDWAAETTAFPNHVVEMALAHTVGNKVEAAYRRGDLFEKRRKLISDWSRYCSTKPTDVANLIPIRQARGDGH